MVNGIVNVCVADFKGENKQFKDYIVKENKTVGKYKSFDEFLEDAKIKLNGEYK